LVEEGSGRPVLLQLIDRTNQFHGLYLLHGKHHLENGNEVIRLDSEGYFPLTYLQETDCVGSAVGTVFRKLQSPFFLETGGVVLVNEEVREGLEGRGHHHKLGLVHQRPERVVLELREVDAQSLETKVVLSYLFIGQKFAKSFVHFPVNEA